MKRTDSPSPEWEGPGRGDDEHKKMYSTRSLSAQENRGRESSPCTMGTPARRIFFPYFDGQECPSYKNHLPTERHHKLKPIPRQSSLKREGT